MNMKTRRNTVLTLVAVAMVLVSGVNSASADTIAGSGFTRDVVAEKTAAAPGDVTDYAGWARWVYAEEGAPFINHPGMPTGGLFSSTKVDYLTEFQLQPYDGPNLLINGDTFTLDTPGRYSDLRIFMPGIGGTFNATVNFTDGSSTALPEFVVSDWQASRDYNASGRMAITRPPAGWDSYFGNGIFTRELDFDLSQEDQAKLVESIDFSLAGRLGVMAVSGTSLESPNAPGDYNGDGIVDRQDVADIVAAYGSDDVNLSVLALTQANLGRVPDPSPTAVPEPSTMLLLLLGTVSIAGGWRRRRR